MKLFEAFQSILEEKQVKITFPEETAPYPQGEIEVHALQSAPNKPFIYYHNLGCPASVKGPMRYCNYRVNPSKEAIMEWFAWLIINNNPYSQILTETLRQNMDAQNNPLANGLIEEILQKDHAEVVNLINSCADNEILNAAAYITMEKVKAGDHLGYGDKESFENLLYKDGIFVYEAGNHFGPEDDVHEEVQTETEFINYLIKNRWIELKCGVIVGRGNPYSYLPYALEKRGVKSIREYILLKKSS